MPGEVFGEADIILRGRLDQFQRDLDEAELLIMQQQDRVVEAQQQAAASVRTAAEEGERANSILGGITKTIGGWVLVRKAIGAVSLALRGVAVAGASSLAVLPAAIAAVTVAAIAAKGAVEEFKASVRTAFDDIDRAKDRLDGSTDSLRELAQALESMPILGGALGTSFRLLAGDAELADEALTNMVATVDEGEVKLKGWARLFGRGIGLNQFIDDIDAANAKLAEMRAVEESRGDFVGRTQSFGEGVDAIQGSAADDLAVARLRGVDAVREAEEQAARDRLRQLDAERDAYRAKISDQLGLLAEQSQQEDANFRQIRLARSALTAELNAQEQKFAEARRQTERDLTRLVQERVA